MSVNKVILLGNLGSNPELKSFPNGNTIATVNLATTERWTDKQTGERREQTQWHRLIFNDGLAKVAGQYLSKGSKVYIEGSLRYKSWKDQNTQETKYATEIRVEQLQMLNTNPNNQNQPAYQNHQAAYQNSGYPQQMPMHPNQGQAWHQQPQGQPAMQTGYNYGYNAPMQQPVQTPMPNQLPPQGQPAMQAPVQPMPQQNMAATAPQNHINSPVPGAIGDDDIPF